MRALDEYAMRILPYGFVRSLELRGAEWDEFDFDKELWSIPSGRMKMKRPLVVPLSRQIVKLLQELREWTGYGRLGFLLRSRRLTAYQIWACSTLFTLLALFSGTEKEQVMQHLRGVLMTKERA